MGRCGNRYPGETAENRLDVYKRQADLFRLTEAEKSSLLAQEKRHALLFMGNQHVKVEFDIPAYKLELMGKGGGR